MKSVEDISESLNSLSQVISMSFMFAKSSPMKAKQSLTNCASYLQSKTFKSTSFVIRFWLVLIDLLKNEHVEILVLSILSIIKQIIDLLKMKEVQIIITNALKVTASEPIATLMILITKCIKSLFFIIKTPEIAKFQTQIWDLIEDELNTAKQQQTRSSNDGYLSDNDDITEYNEESKQNMDDIHNDNASVTTNTSYLPSRAWYGITSMFGGGYNQGSGEEDNASSHSVESEPNKQTESQYVHTPTAHSITSFDPVQSVQTRSRRTQSDGNIRTCSDERMARQHNRNIQCEYKDNVNRSGSVTVNDWVYLILFIDDLEDGGELQIHEGDELRKLALDQHQSLLIVYKCYALEKPSRFLRYARDILKQQKQLKLLHKLEMEQEQEQYMEVTQSLDALHLSPSSIDRNVPTDIKEDEYDENDDAVENELVNDTHENDNQNANTNEENEEIRCID
eukprot:58618_1